MKPTRFTLLLVSAGALAAACTAGNDEDNPAIVDDVYVAGGGPSRILLDGDTAWIVDSVDNTVDVVDLTTCGDAQGSCQRTARIQLDAGSGPFDGVVSGGNAYIAQTFAESVAVIPAAASAPSATITTGAGGALASPQSVAAASGKLFVANANGFGFGPGFVSVVEGTSITASITTTQLQPLGFANLPDGNLAVTNLGYVDFSTGVAIATSAGGIDIIDPDTETIVRNIGLGLTAPINRPAVQGDYGYVASGVSGEVYRVNLTTGSSDTITVVPGSAFLSWTLVDAGRLFVLSYTEDRIYVYDASTMAPIEIEPGVSWIQVGPGGATPKGPVHAVIWNDGEEKHLLVLLSAAHSITDVRIGEILP